jgi:hypothetical protein
MPAPLAQDKAIHIVTNSLLQTRFVLLVEQVIGHHINVVVDFQEL